MTLEPLQTNLSAPEPRYVPLPRPEEVERWLRLAFVAGLEYGQRLNDPKGGDAA
jgi:hypothetical protein